MIALQQVSKSFARGTASEVKALNDVSLLIPRGQFAVLLGANGSGKSTLMNLVAGTVQPDSGRILLDGQDVTGTPDYGRSRWVSRIFQDPLTGTAPSLSLLENLRLAALRCKPKTLTVGTGKEFRKRASEMVSSLELGLETKLDQPVGTLSGGQRQALSLLMAVMDDTRILLLDEPTAALDPRTSVRVMELADRIIRQYGLTAVMITHQLKDAIRFGDRILVLSEGRVLADISGQERNSLQVNDLLKWFEG